MTPPLLLVHGWGFDSGLWEPMLRFLPGRRVFRAEFGYLGAEPRWPAVPHGTLLVAHSAGVLESLLRPPAGCAGLVAINGFTRFPADDGFPGVPARVLLRMMHGFATSPGPVLEQFRARCGGAPAAGAGPIVPAALADGLRRLRDADARPALRAFPAPVLALAAVDDPIVTPAHTSACLAAGALRWSETGGHLLPLTRPDWCAAAVEAAA